MPRIPIFRLGQAPAQPDPPRLASYKPSLSLEGLQVGVDNLRQDVYLSPRRSEEHTSELQSQSNLVCRLLLEKKKKHTTSRQSYIMKHTLTRLCHLHLY